MGSRRTSDRPFGLNIHGVQILVDCAVPEGAMALRTRLAPYVRTRPTRSDLQVEIRPATARLEGRIAGVARQLVWHRIRPFWGELDHDVLRCTDGASLFEVDYVEGRARLDVARETQISVTFFERTFLLLPIVELLRSKGLFYLHGALVTKDDWAILLVGEGGSGKSTLAAAHLMHGWRLVADDTLLLREGAGGLVEVLALEQTLSLAPEVLRQLGRSARGTSKQRVPVRSLSSHQRSLSARPTEILLLTGEGIPGLVPIHRSTLFAAIVRENPMVLAVPRLAPAHVRTVRALLHQASTHRFVASRQTPVRLSTLYDQLSPHLQPLGLHDRA